MGDALDLRYIICTGLPFRQISSHRRVSLCLVLSLSPYVLNPLGRSLVICPLACKCHTVSTNRIRQVHTGAVLAPAESYIVLWGGFDLDDGLG